MFRELDQFDRRILAQVQADATRTSSELSERIGLSQAPCWRRLQRLRQEGFIAREVAILDRAKVGLAIEVFAHVKLAANGRVALAAFTERIEQYPQVLECHVLLGPTDCLLRVVAEDMAAYQRFFLDTLTAIPGVQDVNSIVSMGTVKSTTVLPLDHLRTSI